LIYRGMMIASGSSAELKAGFGSDVLYEITAQPVIKVLGVLSESKWVKDVALFGNGLHLTLNETACIDDVHKVIKDNGFSIDNIEQVQPSLEDVFVSLIENADKEAS
ncbi:MAG: ATP-binding protein DrrA1-3 family domain-containing protein, partial [Armatimonadota bacterium]